MNDLITVKPKEKRKGFLTENLVLNKTPIDHEIVFNKIKGKNFSYQQFNSNLEDVKVVLENLNAKN